MSKKNEGIFNLENFDEELEKELSYIEDDDIFNETDEEFENSEIIDTYNEEKEDLVVYEEEIVCKKEEIEEELVDNFVDANCKNEETEITEEDNIVDKTIINDIEEDLELHKEDEYFRSSSNYEEVESLISIGKEDLSSNENNCVDVLGKDINNFANEPVCLDSIKNGVVGKIPVVLAQLTVQINIMSDIKLPESAIEIKNIKKRVKLTQCLLLQDTNVLFIKGFIRKNIDYATRTCSNYEGICGDIKHCTVDIPFECTTSVTFNGKHPEDVEFNTSNEFEYFKVEELPKDFAQKDKLLSGDLSEYNQISTEYYNELPYCELIKSRIIEFDEYINRKSPDYTAPFEEREFDKIEEKMVVYLTLKLLQNCQVVIPRSKL